MKNLLALFCLLLFSATNVFGQEEDSYDLSLELWANDPMTASSSDWILVRPCNSSKADSFYVRFSSLRHIRYSEPNLWLNNEQFYSQVLCKIFNKECIDDSSKWYGFFISYKEYEQYNNPDSILNYAFHQDGLCSVSKEDSLLPREERIKTPWWTKSWCYGSVGEDLEVSREMKICLLVLFDHRYFISQGCDDIIYVSKMMNDKQTMWFRESRAEEMILWQKKSSDEELKRERESAMSKRK